MRNNFWFNSTYLDLVIYDFSAFISKILIISRMNKSSQNYKNKKYWIIIVFIEKFSSSIQSQFSTTPILAEKKVNNWIFFGSDTRILATIIFSYSTYSNLIICRFSAENLFYAAFDCFRPMLPGLLIRYHTQY